MDSLVVNWSLRDFPATPHIPVFKYVRAVGPGTSDLILKKLQDYDTTVERIDFDSGDLDVLKTFESIDGSGDFLFVVYSDPGHWVYVMSSDLGWAVLFSNVDPDQLAPPRAWTEAEGDFRKSFIRRTSQDSAYYDEQKLVAWASIAQVYAAKTQ